VIELIDVPLPGAEAIAEGEKRTFAAGEFDVLVCRVKGVLYAVENRCSHQDTPLCEGRISGHFIICPKHNAQFDVRDGRHKGPPAYKGIARFDLAIGADGVSVTVPAKKQPKDLGIGAAPMIHRR
jgi:nitrite reductase/ring-hydroxylating ferredoxin subunit